MSEANGTDHVVSDRPPKTSRLATASFVMGLATLSFLFPVFFLPAIVCGIIALVKISRSHGALGGKGLATTGILIPSIFTLLATVSLFVLPWKKIDDRLYCGTHLKGIGTALVIYENNHNDTLPVGDNWCDVLIADGEVELKSLICRGDDAIAGESSYAINRHVAGKSSWSFPGDIVLLFETNAGRESGKRTYPIENRPFYKLLDGEQTGKIKKKRVYQHRWNQVGGPEILTTEHHGGKGCNVLFVNGRTAFILAEDIGDLRWAP